MQVIKKMKIQILVDIYDKSNTIPYCLLIRVSRVRVPEGAPIKSLDLSRDFIFYIALLRMSNMDRNMCLQITAAVKKAVKTSNASYSFHPAACLASLILSFLLP